MGYHFKKHYSRDEARALLPQIRQWLKQLSTARQRFGRLDQRLAGLLAGGQDTGGEMVNQWVKVLADIKVNLREFQKREIQIKDFERGLGIIEARAASLNRFLQAYRTLAQIPPPVLKKSSAG